MAALASVACAGGCDCPSSAAATSGSLTDGSGDYIDNQDCSWVISASSASSISISFSSFDTESGYDYVRINSCVSSSGATSCDSPVELAELSGNSVLSSGNSWTSTTGIMRVHFTSDGSVTRSGFVALWQISGEACTECAAGIFSLEDRSLFMTSFSSSLLPSSHSPSPCVCDNGGSMVIGRGHG